MEDKQGKEGKIAKDLDRLDAIEEAQLQRVGGQLTKKQKATLHDIDRLIKSLGPTHLEDELDSANYSRPVPPRNHAITTEYAAPLSEKSRATFSDSEE